MLKTEIRFGRDHTDSIGVAHATTPALDTDDWVTARKDAELNALLDTPLQTRVDIFLPRMVLEVRLSLGEVEWPDTAVEVRVLVSY